MNRRFGLILFIACFLFLLGIVLPQGQKQALADEHHDDDDMCIPSPFPPDFWILHKTWKDLNLFPCGDKDHNKPTPTPDPSTTPAPTSAPTDNGGSSSGSSSSNNGGGSSSGQGCNDAGPSGAPTLLSVTDLGGGKMELKWTAISPVSHYALAYGPSSHNYVYGQTDIGNITDYTVASLERGKSYCFVISAVNGCSSSAFSNEMCSGAVLGASTGPGQVLGLSYTAGDTKTTELGFLAFGLLCVMSGLYLRKSKSK